MSYLRGGELSSSSTGKGLAGKLSSFSSKLVKALKDPRKIYYKVVWNTYLLNQDRLFIKHFVNKPNGQDTIILASYPKSGSTFFRFVWLNIINIMELGQPEIDFNLLDDYMPFEGFYVDLKKDWPFRSLPCLLKSHSLYSKKYEKFRAVHLFRNPLDTMVSNFFYSLRRARGPEYEELSWLERKFFNLPVHRFEGSFYDFLQENFEGYCRHFKSWMSSRAVPVSYEVLTSQAALRSFSYVFEKLNFTIDDQVLREAIELSNRDRLKRKAPSKKMAKLERMHFIRDGSVGQWKDHFGERELKFVLGKLTEHGLSSSDSFPEEYRQFLLNWPDESFLEETKNI
jgi:hypothetical protein